MTPRPRAAIVHDYLNQPGGAERVVLEMAKIWPEAPIYTSIYRPNSTFSGLDPTRVRTSFLDRLPVDRRFRALLPLYPLAFHSLGRIDADLVICSSSGWAHGVRTAADSTQVVYCHTPARWLYQPGRYVRRVPAREVLRPVFAPLRAWDRRAARRADRYIANSQGVRKRIQEVYGIDANVVHPPVDVERFEAKPRGTRLLVVSRLLPYKRIDLIVEAATQLGRGLDVVGGGPELERLRALAGPTVEFHGRLRDVEVEELMEACDAYCLPGSEDFGISAVEGNAAGKPVLAYASGGALETLIDGVTGVFFREPTVSAVVDALRRLDELSTSPRAIADAAQRFSPREFRHRLEAAVTGTEGAASSDRDHTRGDFA